MFGSLLFKRRQLRKNLKQSYHNILKCMLFYFSINLDILLHSLYIPSSDSWKGKYISELGVCEWKWLLTASQKSSQNCCLHLVAGHLLLGLKSLGLSSSQFVSDFFLASYKKSQWPIGTMLLSLKKNSSLPAEQWMWRQRAGTG